MLGQGKFAEGTTRKFVKDMQYSSLLPVNQQWLMDMHQADADDVEVEERACHHECRRTRAVNDASIKTLTSVLMNRFPPDEGEQQQIMNSMEDMIWIGACFIWKMVENILEWIELGPAQQVRLVYDGVEPAIGRPNSMRHWESVAKDCHRLGRLPIDIDSGSDEIVWKDYVTLTAKNFYWAITQ